MKRTVIDEQTLMVRIKSPSWVCFGQGASGDIPGKEWYVGEFTTQEEADAIFEDVKRKYQEEEVANGSWMAEPKMTIDWETSTMRVVDGWQVAR